MEQGADFDGTDSGDTPLHVAVTKGLVNCIEILVKAGANILAKNTMGLTPLDLAYVWKHRAIARYLQHCLWYQKKKDEMEETKLAQKLYKDLIHQTKQENLNRKPLTEEKVDEWAKKKGLSQLKPLTPKSKASKYHKKCSLPEQSKRQPKPTKGQSKRFQEKKGVSRRPSKQLPLLDSPWTVFGLQPEKRSTEPDLREDVLLLKDSINQRLHYMTKWDTVPHLTPHLPQDVIQRVLFPKAFPSRLNASLDFEPRDIDNIHQKRISSQKEHLSLDRGADAPR